MGQLLLVQAGPAGPAGPVFERGLAMFRSLFGLAPTEALSDPRFGVATFPRLTGTATGLHRSGPRFLVSAGTWVCEGPDKDPLLNVSRHSGTIVRAALDGANGLFFVAAGDADSITCATDFGGRLHAYHAEIDGCAVISTSALALAAMLGAPFDPLGCQEMLGTGSVFEDRSLFQGVRKLEPATVFELRGGRIVSKDRTWDVRSLFPGSMSNPLSTVPALADALVTAVGRTLTPFERPVLDLTGGFDSRAIVGAAITSGRPFQCVVNGGDEDPDVRSAEQIAKRFDLKLHRLRPEIDYGTRSLGAIERAVTLTDGEFDGAEYADVLEIHERLARHGDATVNGSAGEVCRGYWWDLLTPRVGSKSHFDELRAARRFVPDDWADGILASPAAPSLARHFAEVIRRANAGLEDLPNTVRADNIYLTLRMHRWAGRLASATDRIWPCATPFMFRRPLEIALTAPIRRRAHDRMMRRLIEHLSPALAGIPMAGGYPASPIRASNAWRFAPLLSENLSKGAGRLRRMLGGGRSRSPIGAPSAVAGLWAQEDIRALLRPDAMKTAGLYEPAALAEFLARSEAPGFTAARPFGRILTLELVAQALARAR